MTGGAATRSMTAATSTAPLLNFDQESFRPRIGSRAAAPLGSKALARLPTDGETKEELRSLAKAGQASSLLVLLTRQWIRDGGCSVDEVARDQRGNTLLMVASQAGQHETVTVLLQLGASPFAASHSVKSVVFARAAAEGVESPASGKRSGSTSFWSSAERSSGGHSIELRYGGMTPLHYASWSGSRRTVRSLCDSRQGAAILGRTADGSSALHCAVTGYATRRASTVSSGRSGSLGRFKRTHETRRVRVRQESLVKHS